MAIVYSHPRALDGSDMWKLVKGNEDLDLNSSYSYFLVSKLFSNRCIIVKDSAQNNKIVGFVMGFVFAEEPETYFIWQISVSKDYRGQGIGKELLERVLQTNEDIKYIKGTISKKNNSYKKVLNDIAVKYNTWMSTKAGFEDDQFPEGHEEEELVLIGPIERE